MKKDCKTRGLFVPGIWYQMRKILIVMKLSLFILLVSLFSAGASVYSQNSRLNLDYKNVSLKEVLGAIEDQSEFRFAYSSEYLELERKVSVRFENESVTNILDNIFKETGIKYSINERMVILYMDGAGANKSTQQRTVSGKVTDSSGAPLPGVTVVVKGTTTGIITDADGNYSLANVSSNATLVFSFVGMKMQEIAVGGKINIDVTLEEETIGIDEVVVTALGIEKSSKSITYTTEKVPGSELTKMPQTNLMNSMSGKVAGMTINHSGAGLGGSVKVLLRGNKSAQGNNQPLYVIDGIPLVNFSRETANNTFSMQDGGDGISNLNPDDIESINILKGASAASLYGSQAANGVILITTKKGKAGMTKVDFSSSFTIDQVSYKPDLQNSYGETNPGSAESWGAPISNATDNISGFFQKGSTMINSVTFSSGKEKMQTYLSYANTSAKGIVEENKLSKHNLKIRESARFFNDKLKLDADVNIVSQSIDNNPVYGYQNGPLYGLYTFPRGKDFAPYKNDYQIFDPVRNLYVQNWPFITADNQNPYWVANKVLNAIDRTRVIASLTAVYDITSWLNIQVRGNMDKTNDITTSKYYVGTAPVYAGLNGRYNISNITYTQSYGDAILNLTHSFGKIQLNGVLGASVTDSRDRGESSGSNELFFPNIFTIQNMNSASPSTGHSSVSERHQQLQSVFGNINMSYKDWLYLDVTGRNDWSSNLSYTPNGSYFYPSAGLGVLLNNLASLPEAISFAKIRGSYAVVGNTVPIYVTNPLNYYSNQGNVTFNNTAPFTDLQPEKTKSLEFGAEIRLLRNQFSLDITYYKSNSINQFFSIVVPPGTGYDRRYINGGDIQNSGVEVMAGYTTLPNKTLKWSSAINYSNNNNVVKKLAPGVDKFLLADDINNYSSILTVGGSYGDIYGQVLKRDEATGKIIINSSGSPVVQTGTRSFVGNPNPDFKLGWNNNFSYKNYILSFLVDGSFGGKVMSLTEQVFDGVGVSKASGDARNNGGVFIDGIAEDTGNSVTLVDAQKWYKTIGGRQHVTGEYMYDATNIRIRELSLGYSLPARILKNGFVKNIKLSLVGRNLLYIYNKAPFDPEITYSTGNGINGVDIFSLPATRSFGFNLNVSF